MSIQKVTIDANLLHEYWKQRKRRGFVEKLVRLARDGKIELAVTARIHEDIPHSPLADKLNELSQLSIMETGTVARIGYWVIGRDLFGDHTFVEVIHTLTELAAERIKGGRKRPPDWRDWDHLHSHYLLKRDVFLTWDEGILSVAEELETSFGIIVMKPEDYLQTLGPEIMKEGQDL